MQDDAIKYYYSLNPYQFAYLEKLVVYSDASLEDMLAHLALEIELIGNEGTLHLTFQGVSSLHFNLPSEHEMLRIKIASLRDAQWEGIMYHITEERNLLSFYCSRFEVSIRA
jgi:hypothetical protein